MGVVLNTRNVDPKRQTARIERQIKDALSKLADERKADLVAEAMRRSLTKRVDKAEGSVKQIVTDLGEATAQRTGAWCLTCLTSVRLENASRSN